MADKIREIQSRLKTPEGGDQIAAPLAYIPLFGWIYPYYLKKEIELCRFHGKQAMQLNVVMLAIYFVVWVLENFPIVSWLFGPDHVFHHITRAIWLLTAIAFIGLSIVGAIKAFSEEMWEIPKLNELIDKIVELIKAETNDAPDKASGKPSDKALVKSREKS